jgi:hypothetical protein
VAAAVIALAVPVATSTYSRSAEAYERRSRRLGADQLFIGTSDELPHAVALAAVRDLHNEFPGALIVPLTRAAYPPTLGSRGVPATVYSESALEGSHPTTPRRHGNCSSRTPTFCVLFTRKRGSTSLHAARHSPSADSSRAGGYVQVDPPPGSSGLSTANIPAVSIDSPSYLNASIPRIVDSHALANDLGLRPQVSGHVAVQRDPDPRMSQMVLDRLGVGAPGDQ